MAYAIAVIRFSELYGPNYMDNLGQKIELVNKDQTVKELHFEMDRLTINNRMPGAVLETLLLCKKPVHSYFTCKWPSNNYYDFPPPIGFYFTEEMAKELKAALQRKT